MIKKLQAPIVYIVLTLATTLFHSCDTSGPNDTIVCTTTIVADLVNHLKPPSISLMGPGVDPHLYKSKSGDHKSLNNAKIIVYSGLHLEGKMTYPVFDFHPFLLRNIFV